MPKVSPAWIRVLVANARQRALERGLPFDLTPQDIHEMWGEQEGRCRWFNVPMQWGDEDEGPRHPMIPTIDRVNNTRGYTRANCVLACWGANAAKGACELDTWETFLDFLRAGMHP